MIFLLALATTAPQSAKITPSRAELVSALRTVNPGESFDAALHIVIQPGWHIYWQNPGESGIPPSITWDLPKGWQVSPPAWPAPVKISTGGVVTYNYESEAILPVHITVGKEQPFGAVTLQAKATWLVCREGCLPAEAKLTLPLRVGKTVVDPDWSAKLLAVRSNLPRKDIRYRFRAFRKGDEILLGISANGATKLPTGAEFYPQDTAVDPSAPQSIATWNGSPALKLKVSSYAPKRIERLVGLYVAPAADATKTGAHDRVGRRPRQPIIV